MKTWWSGNLQWFWWISRSLSVILTFTHFPPQSKCENMALWWISAIQKWAILKLHIILSKKGARGRMVISPKWTTWILQVWRRRAVTECSSLFTWEQLRSRNLKTLRKQTQVHRFSLESQSKTIFSFSLFSFLFF